MRRLAFAIGLALTLGCSPGPAVTVASPSPSPSIATATASPSPSPTPTATAGPINVATAVGTIPRSFHYFDTGQGAGYRILLFDENKTEPPAVVLTSGQPMAPAGPGVRSDALTVSADGQVLVVMRRVSEQQTSYYVLRPQTGELRTLFNGPDLGPPIISADGQRVAFTRTSADPAINGLWVLAVAGAASPTRLVTDMPLRVGSPPQPLAWSDDGKWLAISPVLGPGGVEVAVVDPTAGETHFNATTNIFEGGNARVIGSGYAVDWRAGEHSLLVTSTRDFIGGRTYLYLADVAGGPNANRDLYAPTGDMTLAPAVWHPALDRFAFLEMPVGRGPGTPTAVWVRRLDGTATRVAESAFLSSPWWSRDGTKLFSITGGDDSTGGISNLLGTGGGTPFCLRGGTPPRCT
jgi:Tol biopolymer transport system component